MALNPLVEKLDAVFSQYIRLLYSFDNRTMARCYTCGKPKLIKDIQNGHFITRARMNTRWHEDNCRPQCKGCNIFGGGKNLEFEEELEDEIGIDAVRAIKLLGREEWTKKDDSWYDEKIIHYKELVKKMGGW
jgi:ssDNA-binding Zn-finger/Zn-ribbon topoisomerase 1